MLIKIDTANKVITIEDSLVSLADLIIELDKLLPDWKEYKLEGVRKEISYVPNFIPCPQPIPLSPIWVAPTVPTTQPWDGYTICQVTYSN